MNQLTSVLELLALWNRRVASLALLFLCLRFAWLSSVDLAQQWQPDTLDNSHRELPDTATQSIFDRFNQQGSSHRPDLEALNELLKPQTDKIVPIDLPPEQRKRRLLVDFGPERSVVYVNGKKVGKTPYVGEVTCADGKEIIIDVLPTHGLPLKRQMHCGGENLIAHE